MKKISWRHIVILAVLLFLLVAICALFFINKASNVRDALTSPPILGNVYYITQIATSIVLILGGFIGIWQYTLTAKAERIKINVDRIQRAIDLAEYYKNKILKKYAVIKFVFEKSGLMQIIDKIDPEQIHAFDDIELNRLLTENDKNQIETIRNSKKFIQTVIEADKIYNLDLNIDKISKVSINNEKKVVEIEFDGNAVMKKFMGNIVTETLNNLEFFSMHFSHKTADESVVYQSLHQTYLSIVHALYYNIAILNNMKSSKYYTNVIELYKVWYNRDKIERNNKINATNTFVTKGTVADEIHG